MPKDMDTIRKQLQEEYKNQWLGNTHYACLTCSHAMNTKDNRLICTLNDKHQFVDEENICEYWS